MKKFVFIVAFALTGAIGLHAQCLMHPVTLSQRISQSSLVVEGKVTAQQSFWNADHNRIYTSSLLEVYKSFKGSAPAYLEVITEGGTVGMNRHHFDPSLELEAGEMGVFTLNANGETSQFGKPVYEPYASAQGFIKYNVKEDVANEPFQAYTNLSTTFYSLMTQLCGEAYAVVKPVDPFVQAASPVNNVQSVAAITSFSPSTITAGTFSVLTINGSGFGATRGTSFVEFKNADDGGATYIKPDPSQYVSWSASQIQVMVPTESFTTTGTAGSGVFRVDVGGVKSTSTSSLTVSYGHLNVGYSGAVYNTKHINQSGGGYVWTYNAAFSSNAAAKAAFERSFGTWRCATYINWTLAAGTTTVNQGLNDNVNVVTFQTGLPAGVLGQCASYWSGCSGGSGVDWYVSELDIVFAPTPGGMSWQFGPAAPTGSQYDFESVTVHELGHGHQLSHVINSSDLMHYALANGQSKRNLNTDDLNGGLAVMARNTVNPVCGEAVMIPLNSSNCSLGPNAAFSTSSTSLCAGATLTLTSTSSGANSYTWTMTGGTPATASTSVTTVSYATAGVKTITLTAGNGSLSSTITKTITVVANPTVNVTPTATTSCSGQARTLTASGGTTYSWLPGSATTASVSVTPSTTTTYTVTGTTSGCSNTKTVTITVSPTPTVTASNSGGICTGSSATLTAGGATSYTWNPGGLTGASVSVSPASTIVYTVTGLSGSCSSTKTTTLTVATQPTVNLSANSVTVCQGTAAGISASGATTYTWNPGGLSGAAPSLVPAITTTYSVVGSNGGCSSATRTTVVTVNPSPSVGASSSQSLICTGQSATITASGATSYTTNPGGLSGSVVSVSPTSSTTYTVTGSNGTCMKTATVSITVSPCTGIEDLTGDLSVTLYPNPNDGVFSIQNTSAHPMAVTIYNSIGQLVIRESLSQETSVINISSYGKGIYYAIINGAGSHRTVKIIVQ